MATLDDIVANGTLHKLAVPLDQGELEERLFYMTTQARDWLSNTLPSLETHIAEGRLSPSEQFDEWAYTFLTGRKFICDDGRDLHEMKPFGSGVWELKTRDIRIFGWFYKPTIFICYSIDSKNDLEILKQKNINVYTYKRQGTIAFRNGLNIDPPLVAANEDIRDELCF